jgi:L-2-amino-thiazoline-4-carboxylic acid hydrolase
MAQFLADATDEVPIGHLQRRRIESRVLIPFIAACREKFGDAATKELVVATIRRLAVEDGARWAEAFGRDMGSLKNVAEKVWAGGGSLDIDMVAAGDDRLDFNVTRCRYAEFYKELGLADLGYLVHCNRDHAMIDGFNPELKLTRTQTVMEGASHCDFRFTKKT